MILAADKLQELLPVDQLSHCDANLNKLRSLGENDKLALELFIAYSEGDSESIDSLKSTLNANLPSLKAGKKVSELTALELTIIQMLLQDLKFQVLLLLQGKKFN